MDAATAVDRLYAEASNIVDLLQSAEPSLAISAGDSLRKGLLLAAASQFEQTVTAAVVTYVSDRAGNDANVMGFVNKKGVERQYHTWFDWTTLNAGQFFGLFGPRFKRLMTLRVKEDDALRDAIEAFMQVGSERNRLVHQDFASFPLDKTLDEIYRLYKEAGIFVGSIDALLREALPEEA